MIRFLITLAAAATATVSLFAVTTLPARAQTPRIISQTHDGKPIVLASMTVTASALPE